MRYTDDVLARNVYGAYEGSTLGITSASPSDARQRQPAASDAAREAEAASTNPRRGNPLAVGLVVIGILVLLMVMARRWGEPGEFANLRASAYNVLFIGLVAVAGIPIIKVAVTLLPDGPWRDYVLAV